MSGVMTVVLAAALTLAMHGGAATAGPAMDSSDLIVFETPSGVHFIRADGTGLRRLPGTRPGDQNPSWSPDGRRITFWTNANEDGEIYVCDADGSNRRRLTKDDPESDYFPSDKYPEWSPDGRLIAFESYRDGDLHIWVMRPDGTGVRRVTRDGRGGGSAEWSPNAKQIAYTAVSSKGTFSLAVVDVEGSATRALHSLSTDHDWSPSWSPDGTRIAFTSTARVKKSELYVVGLEDGPPMRLTRNNAQDFDPVWSRNGEQILFASGRAGFWEVYVMDADGSNERRVTRIPTEYACCGDWGPVG